MSPRPLLTVRKDPDAIRDYGFDWSEWLESGDQVASATWTIPAGLNVESEETVTATITKVWLSGGTAGESYQVSCLITTQDGRTDERTMEIVVEER